MLIDKPRFPMKEMVLHGWLPSPLKKLFYRLKRYRIGRGVHLGLGSVICGRDVEIGDHTEIGFLSFVRGKTIRIGSHVQIGSTTMVDTPHVEIGDGTRINEQVFVGGLQFPDSKLIVGRNCQIMQMTFINPARSITIGDDTGIGGHSLLFGHTSWLNKFEGYPVDFDTIEIGNSVSLAWRVFILPGTKIGDGAVVGANSLVKGTVPPRCLAVGFPARVVSTAPQFPREVSDAEKRQFLEEILVELVDYLQVSGLACRRDGSMFAITDTRPRRSRSRQTTWRLAVASDVISRELAEPSIDVDVFLSLRSIPPDHRRRLTERGVVWIDIETKERSDAGNDLAEEVAQHLRRYGVRLFRRKPDSGCETSLQTCAASRAT
jgi:acetyltransferase-like isoleucine patch superfamily enzyme